MLMLSGELKLDLDQTQTGRLTGDPHPWRSALRRLAAVSRINSGTPVRQNQQHVVRNAAVAFHPRGAAGHARYREPARFRPLGEQPPDFPGRHVAFDRIAVDHRRVATTVNLGHAEPCPVDVRIPHILKLHTEAIGPQMVDPRAAAASGWALVDGDRFIGGMSRMHGLEGRCKNRKQEFTSFHLICSFAYDIDWCEIVCGRFVRLQSSFVNDAYPLPEIIAASPHASRGTPTLG